MSLPRVTALAALSLAANAQQPEQAHLAWTGLAGQLSLDFISHENCSHTYGAQISTSPDFSTASFVQAYACDAFTVSQTMPSWNVRVLFKGLAAGTKYYYVCGAEDLREPWSQVFTFTYNSGASRAGGPTYAVLADFGFFNAESLERLQAQAYDGVFDAVLHAGDFAYDFDSDGGMVGDGYMRQLQPVIAQMPYMGIPGNHESSANYTHWKTRFASVGENAGVNSGSGTQMFYSFDEQLVHFVMWDSEAFWSQPADSQTAMTNWLIADLAKANANRGVVPWVIALSHKTWWMDSTLNCPDGAGCGIWKILVEGGVDLSVSGHIHYYARNFAQYPNANNGAGAVDTACANNNLGNSTHPAAIYTDCTLMPTIITAAPGDQEVNRRRVEHKLASGAGQATVTSTDNYGFSLMQIVNATHLHWTFSTAVPHVNSTNPDYSDDLWLVVNNHGPRTNLPPV